MHGRQLASHGRWLQQDGLLQARHRAGAHAQRAVLAICMHGPGLQQDVGARPHAFWRAACMRRAHAIAPPRLALVLSLSSASRMDCMRSMSSPTDSSSWLSSSRCRCTCTPHQPTNQRNSSHRIRITTRHASTSCSNTPRRPRRKPPPPRGTSSRVHACKPPPPPPRLVAEAPRTRAPPAP